MSEQGVTFLSAVDVLSQPEWESLAREVAGVYLLSGSMDTASAYAKKFGACGCPHCATCLVAAGVVKERHED